MTNQTSEQLQEALVRATGIGWTAVQASPRLAPFRPAGMVAPMRPTAKALAHARLERWFRAQDSAVAPTSPEDWTISSHEQSLVFTPADGRRSDLVFLMDDMSVVSFAPSTRSIQDAYLELTGPQRSDVGAGRVGLGRSGRSNGHRLLSDQQPPEPDVV